MSGDKNPETIKVSGFVRPLLAENLTVIKEITGNSADVVIRKLKTGADEKIELAVVYVGGITDEKAI